MWCVVAFGGIFIVIGLMALIMGKMPSPDQIFSRKNDNENWVGKKARVAGVVCLLIGIVVISWTLIYFGV